MSGTGTEQPLVVSETLVTLLAFKLQNLVGMEESPIQGRVAVCLLRGKEARGVLMKKPYTIESVLIEFLKQVAYA